MTLPARTFVLSPGAGSGPWYWHRVELELSERGHEVVAVDLPCEDPGAGLATYASRTVDAIEGRDSPIIVAQSFGTWTAAIVCSLIPVEHLALVAPMVPKVGETAAEWWDATDQPLARRRRATIEGRADTDDPRSLFLHDVPTDLVSDALGRGRDQSDRPFHDPFPLEAWPSVPTAVIVGRLDRFLPISFQRRVIQERLGLRPIAIDAGHTPALSQPRELADLLEQHTIV